MAASVPTSELLRRTALFAALSDDVRAAVARGMRRQEFAGGQLIFARGDAGRELFLVTSGRVRLSVLSAEGRELAFHHAAPGDVFGEIAVLDDGPRTADAAAVGAVSCMVLSGGELRRLIADHPTLAEAAIRLLCVRLRDADLQLEGVALHRIEVRLARFLLSRARQSADAGAARACNLELGMSQSDLALLIGASRPKVNAALMVLEEQGAIRREGAGLACDIAMLEAIAEIE